MITQYTKYDRKQLWASKQLQSQVLVKRRLKYTYNTLHWESIPENHMHLTGVFSLTGYNSQWSKSNNNTCCAVEKYIKLHLIKAAMSKKKAKTTFTTKVVTKNAPKRYAQVFFTRCVGFWFAGLVHVFLKYQVTCRNANNSCRVRVRINLLNKWILLFCVFGV